MAVGINKAMGVDVSLDHNSVSVGRGIGGVRNGGVVICGRVGVRSLVREIYNFYFVLWHTV